MPSIAELAAKGKVLDVRETKDGRLIVFQPQGTNYELHLLSEEPFGGELNKPIELSIRVQARKVYTVPSGGNFIQPIFGPPRIIQGRVKYLDEKEMVVQAGAPIIVQLPAQEDAYDLASGDLSVASLMN